MIYLLNNVLYMYIEELFVGKLGEKNAAPVNGISATLSADGQCD